MPLSEAPLEIGLTLDEAAPHLDLAGCRELLQFAACSDGRQGEVGVWVCSDDDIADLHLRFMSIGGPTDVLSFNGDAPYLGDIAVSFETAARQSRDAGHAVQREIAYLILHGLLHLFGYDDLTSEKRVRMFARQDELMIGYESEAGDDCGDDADR